MKEQRSRLAKIVLRLRAKNLRKSAVLLGLAIIRVYLRPFAVSLFGQAEGRPWQPSIAFLSWEFRASAECSRDGEVVCALKAETSRETLG